jgi:LPXTG-motif cell wall-anchored protein
LQFPWDFSFALTNLGPGTYYYLLTETPGASIVGDDPEDYNWTYDDRVYMVRVVVSVDGEGNLEAVVEYTYKTGESGNGAYIWSEDWAANSANNPASFSNTYNQPMGEYYLQLGKFINNITYSGSYEFGALITIEEYDRLFGDGTDGSGRKFEFEIIEFISDYDFTDYRNSTDGFNQEDFENVKQGGFSETVTLPRMCDPTKSWFEANGVNPENYYYTTDTISFMYLYPGNHYYLIREKIPETIPAGWTYDDSIYILEIVASPPGGGLVSATPYIRKIQGAGVPLTRGGNAGDIDYPFYNRYENPYGPRLPQTGGDTMRWFTLAGVGLMAFAGIMRVMRRKRGTTAADGS